MYTNNTEHNKHLHKNNKNITCIKIYCILNASCIISPKKRHDSVNNASARTPKETDRCLIRSISISKK